MRKRSKATVVLLMFTMLLLVFAVGVIYINRDRLGEYKKLIDELRFEINNHKMYVYVADCDIESGTIIDESMIKKKEIYTELEENLFFDEKMIGYEALIDISKNEPLKANMFTEFVISSEYKEYEVSTVEIMDDQKEHDYIDIRIMFPDGADYLVVPHKKIFDLNSENLTFNIHCSESEILTMTSAIIDTYTIPGTKMYAVRYINGAAQESAIPNYPVRNETITIINTDPNVVYRAKETINKNVREALENRMKGFENEGG
ncbi:MAG: hypothetical protein IJW18_02225 [Lachnospiraceae bacterium]|nr:hypothetical protein [Lachnospiraceae bacterium]